MNSKQYEYMKTAERLEQKYGSFGLFEPGDMIIAHECISMYWIYKDECISYRDLYRLTSNGRVALRNKVECKDN